MLLFIMIEKEFHDVVEYLLKSKLIETCVAYQAKNTTQYTKDDIVQDMWEWVMTYDKEKLIDAHKNKHLNALITGVLRRQLFSKNSPHFRKYKKFDLMTDDLNYLTEKEDSDD